MPFFYRITKGTLSISQLHHALQLIIIKHLTLRTSLIFDEHNNQLMQRVNTFDDDNKQLFTFIQSTFSIDEQLTHIMHNERSNPHLFNLAQGLVFRCHLVCHRETSTNNLLYDKDIIIFNFHHAAFDLPSMNLFLHDLHQAYTTGQLTPDDHTTLRYLDCKCIDISLLFSLIRYSLFST